MTQEEYDKEYALLVKRLDCMKRDGEPQREAWFERQVDRLDKKFMAGGGEPT